MPKMTLHLGVSLQQVGSPRDGLVDDAAAIDDCATFAVGNLGEETVQEAVGLRSWTCGRIE